MHSVELEKYTGMACKHTCPSCGHKKVFTRYINNESGGHIDDAVGRCDRESNCGYHLAPKEFFAANPDKKMQQPSYSGKKPPETLKIDYMPFQYVDATMKGFDETNFAKYLISLFGPDIAKRALLKYLVGRSKLDQGRANIFWRIDINQQVRTGKIMFYNPESGKRNKDQHPTWTHAFLKSFNHHLCFFGEHLLAEYAERPVCIVESEKTAVIASVYMPENNWIATGGASGCKWREYSVYKVLAGKDITLFPDFGKYNGKDNKMCFQEWSERADHIKAGISCKIHVSRVLEDTLKEPERANDYDLSDMLVKRDEKTGHALTDEGYPMMWDIKTSEK